MQPPPPPSSPYYEPVVAAPAVRRGSGPLIAGLVAVAVLAGGGTYLLTRSTEIAAPTPSTTVGATTPTPDDTAFAEGPAAGGTVVVPAGALDLGDGVFLPLDTTVEISGDDPYTVASTVDSATMIVQVLRRPASEDPNVPLQEYVDGFDADFTLISYLPSVTATPGVLDADTVRETSLGYTIYRSNVAQTNLTGKVLVWVRNDGLLIMADIFGSGASPISDGAFATMIESLADAPAINPPAAWFPAVSKLPDTIHQGADLPFNPSRQLALPSGFEVIDRSAASVTASNGNDQVTATGAVSVATRDDAHAAAAAALAERFPGATPGAFVKTGSREYTFERSEWAGVDTDGMAVTGSVWLQFDEGTQTVVVVVVAHRTATWDQNSMEMMVASTAQSGPGAAGSAGGQ